MQKRGQGLSYIFYILVGIIIIAALFFYLKPLKQVGEKAASSEIIALATSIQTKILQQSFRQEGSSVNADFSVPPSISKVCLFDAGKEYEAYKSPEIVSLYSEDKLHNLFISTENGIYPFFVKNLELDKQNNPLCLKISNSQISLKLTSRKQKSLVEADISSQDIRCISVMENGSPDKKIDMVFLGYGFKDSTSFSTQVSRSANNILLEFSPYKEYRKKFNFYRIDSTDIECTIGDFIKCDQYQIKKAASDCPNDLIVLLVDRSAVAELVNPVRSSAIANIVKVNTADRPFVLVHELGHALGNLADEYVDEAYYSLKNFKVSDYPNCDTQPCSLWKGTNNTGCYAGCSLKQYFRPTKDSIMRSLSSATYGPVNEKELVKRLLYYE
jgi:hypothetical protein